MREYKDLRDSTVCVFPWQADNINVPCSSGELYAPEELTLFLSYRMPASSVCYLAMFLAFNNSSRRKPRNVLAAIENPERVFLRSTEMRHCSYYSFNDTFHG
ncbi:hypothetical protein SDJN02_18754, partial [Cucurbita argyrosperma subsp. argyrosperma]